MPCAKVVYLCTENLGGERRGSAGQLTRVVLRDHTYLGLSMFCKKGKREGRGGGVEEGTCSGE
jgi:hypothetical protein